MVRGANAPVNACLALSVQDCSLYSGGMRCAGHCSHAVCLAFDMRRHSPQLCLSVVRVAQFNGGIALMVPRYVASFFSLAVKLGSVNVTVRFSTGSMRIC